MSILSWLDGDWSASSNPCKYSNDGTLVIHGRMYVESDFNTRAEMECEGLLSVARRDIDVDCVLGSDGRSIDAWYWDWDAFPQAQSLRNVQLQVSLQNLDRALREKHWNVRLVTLLVSIRLQAKRRSSSHVILIRDETKCSQFPGFLTWR